MSRTASKLLSAIFFAAISATSVQAQEDQLSPDDWTLTIVPESKSTIAFVEFDSGISLAARCVDGAYDLLIIGLTEAPPRTTKRDISFSVGEDDDFETTVWSVGQDRTTAFSRVPAMVARQMAEGGKLQIATTDTTTGQRTRYVMHLDASSNALEQTLTACGRPLVDPRDKEVEGNGRDGLPIDIAWVRPPRPIFPAAVRDQSPAEGYAVMTCVARSNGSLEDCQIESEAPRGYNLGRAAQRAIYPARVRLVDNAADPQKLLDSRLIRFSVNFIME